MNYHDIKNKEIETTKDYSEKKFRIYIKSHKILLSLYSKWVFWFSSFIPIIVIPIIFGDINLYPIFVFAHFLYWYFKGEAKYHKDCDQEIEEIELTIIVLEDIQKERNENG
jgi:hypothetical protein